MKKLVIVRHGSYDTNDQLSENGKIQITELAQRLRQHISGCSVLILTSTADRASQSADILAREYDTVTEAHDALWSDEDHFEDYEKAMNLIELNENRADALIVVTHDEYDCLARIYCFEKCGERPNWYKLEKGQAVIFDPKDKTHTIVN